MIHQFEEWSANLAEQSSMESLKDVVVGIEATEYLNRLPKMNYPELTRPVQEALLPALGGVPFGLKHIIKHHISVWRKYGITPLFVFNGLDIGKGDPTFNASEENARVSTLAWNQYSTGNAAATVQTFGDSNLVTAKDLYRFLQTILQEQEVAFLVAPYCAWAQLAYLQKHNAIDTIYGASEVFLFDVPEIITKWNFMEDQVVWVRRRACLQSLNISSDAFIDACMLSGNDLLEAIPQLAIHRKQQPRMKNAAEMVMTVGHGSGDKVCTHFHDDGQLRSMNYQEKYRKARLAVKHHVILSVDGKVELFKVEQAPNDVHEFIGQRLPDELYYYLSKGLISTRILNWLTSSEVLESPPLDGGESEEYRHLVRDQLTEMRTSTLSILAWCMHNWYKRNNLDVRCWFNKEDVRIINIKAIVDDPRKPISKWNVHEDVFDSVLKTLESSGTIGKCVRLLENKSFAAQTVTSKTVGKPLKTKDEILLNSMWRLLQLRGYIDEKHNLTSWGQVLHAVITATSFENTMPANDLEEGALIAVELARHGLLNANSMFGSYGGAPHHGNDKDKRCTLLVSRIANFGRFDHQGIGYTGPLSRNMLAYNSLVNAVRSGLRDMAEVCATTMFMSGEVARDSCDLTELGLDLPFLINNDCVLAVAALSHFGEMSIQEKPISDEVKAGRLKFENDVLFKYAEDYPKQIDKILVLWDAVYKGVTVMPDTFKQKGLFDEVNEWLAPLR